MKKSSKRKPVEIILRELKRMADPANVAGMARFRIRTGGTLGVPIPALRVLSRKLGRDHALALALWDSGIHEARILAALVDEPEQVTRAQLERWVREIDSWDICDQCCSNLFDRTPFAWTLAAQWSRRRAEFIRRAGYVMMATLAVHDSAAPDAAFRRFYPLIEAGAADERNFVRKAVNWALRQIGKRSRRLNREAVRLAQKIRKQHSPAARWIAADALRELTHPKTVARLKR